MTTPTPADRHSLVVTGASGQLGRRVTDRLLQQVDAVRLVLVTRRPEELSTVGADVRFGDFDDPASLESAFAGARRMLLISTDAVGRRIPQHTNAIDAAKQAGIGHIAYTSLPNPTADNPAGVTADHIGTEAALEASGVAWTFLRNALYADYRVPEAQQAGESGTFHHNHGDGRSAYVSRRDCAAAAAAVLVGGGEHDGRAYDITGPELLGGDDLARLYGEAVDRLIDAVALDDDTFASALAGLPAEMVDPITSFGTAVRVGALDQISDHVEALTGVEPATVASVLRRELAHEGRESRRPKHRKEPTHAKLFG